jgi:protein-L-isoaspartate(D-aspartate) O-methyltransferase
MTLDAARAKMIDRHLEGRGITQRRLLEAFGKVPREAFIPDELVEFAYDDTPLPIGEEQTISQPYIVAVSVEALELQRTDRVLEVGTGSGYAAAIIGELAGEVFSVERHAALAFEARERLARLGYDTVHVLHGDGSLGWTENAPYDAILVSAAAPRVPPALLEQLAPGGRLVVPVESEGGGQVLTRVRRELDHSFREQPIVGVRFVPLVGEQAYPERERVVRRSRARAPQHGIGALIRESAEPLEEMAWAALDASTSAGATRVDAGIEALIERIGDSRVVLLGEATHGSSEFYRTRANITRALIERKAIDFIAIEADWPDAGVVNDYVLGGPRWSALELSPFTRFPTWMWRNQETWSFIEWLRAFNHGRSDGRDRVGFHGLDLYSMFTSIHAVLAYLDGSDPALAAEARERYGALMPWQKNPAAYGEAVLVGKSSSAEDAVVSLLGQLLERRLAGAHRDRQRFFDATRNATLVASAERYYRAMYHSGPTSWNLRDAHMFSTLESLLGFYGPDARGVVWEHNSHVGDATATEMGSSGELNVGQLCRVRFGPQAYIVGFGTDHGTVAAASRWGGPMQRMKVRPADPDSYEGLCHSAERAAFVLNLRDPTRSALRDELLAPRLERAIGVVYRPDTELASHYFNASLPLQFDEYVWLDETHAVQALPVPTSPATDVPKTFPFGL